MSNKKVIYLAGAIRGDPSYRDNFKKIIKIVEDYAITRTELSDMQMPTIPSYAKEEYKQTIYERDIEWIKQSKAVIAEVSGASTGAGYEIAYAIHVKKCPILCLYLKTSRPSLMIAQNNEKYLFKQEYSNDNDLYLFIRTFLVVIEKFPTIEQKKMAYLYVIKNITREENINNYDLYINSLLNKYSNNLEEERFNKELLNYEDIDFKDSKLFIDFLFKSIILQSRWINLKSQRIGSTFISGNKPRIITSLAKYTFGDISNIYKKLDINELDYSEFAFKKNLRDYRLIGMLYSLTAIKYGSTKIKNLAVLQATLLDELKIMSKTSKRKINPSIFIVTNYIKNLSKFIKKYNVNLLIKILEECVNKNWFKNLDIYPEKNIDEIKVDNILSKNGANELLNYLFIKNKEFYESNYSSFYEKGQLKITISYTEDELN